MRRKIAKILAWISLAIIIVIIAFLMKALVTKDGMLALAMFFSLVFVSIIVYMGIGALKRLEQKEEDKENENINKFAKTNTKNL